MPFGKSLFLLHHHFILWSFLEGMNYVFICKKINIIFPPENKYLNIGAITGGVVCIVIHGMIGLDILTNRGNYCFYIYLRNTYY
jgi:hypothetical protein